MKVPTIPRTEMRDSTPMVSIIDIIEQNTAMGITFMIIVVTRRKMSLSSLSSSFTVETYLPNMAVAMPNNIAIKMSCSMLDFKKGSTIFVGIIPMIVSATDTLEA